jgi:hypothetical protein
VDGESGTFINPADYDYRENILYANGVEFSGNLSNTIYRVKGVPLNIDDRLVNIGTNSSVPFSHVRYSRFSPLGTSTLFVGTTSGKLYKVQGAETQTPATTEIGSPDFPTANISCVASGNNEDVLLVVFSNYGVSSVWLTTDGGTTWIEKEANLPDMPLRWALFHPNNNGQAMLATETGIWATNTLFEDETVWAPATDGMANVRVDQLTIRTADDVVLAASHGRGLFTAEYELDIYVGEEEIETPAISFDIYPNPATDRLTIAKASGMQGKVVVTITDINGRVVYEDLESVSGRFEKTITLNDLSKGIYMVNLYHDGQKETGKFLIK